MSQKLAVITGASSGIGRACARQLIDDKYQVINADLATPDGVAEEPVHVKCDVSSSADIDSLYAQVNQDFGVPDVLISNAGVGVHELLSEGDPNKWETLIGTNLLGPLRLIRAFLPDMLTRKKGHIIFMSSVAARKPHPYGGIYAASKAGLEVVAETLRLEVQPHIRVSVVAPGAIDTPFFKHTLSGARSYDELQWQRVTPEDVAHHVAYLLSLPAHMNMDYSIVRPTDQPF